MGLKDYIRIFKRHKWWIVGWFLLITLGYWFYESEIKPVRYYSNASFRVEGSQPDKDPRATNLKSTFSEGELGSDILFRGAKLSPEVRKESMLSDPVMTRAFKTYSKIASKNSNLNSPGRSSLNQSPYPVFEDNAPTKANIKKFKDCLEIEITRTYSFVIKAHSTNKYKAKWMVESFLQAYEVFEEESSQRRIRDVLDQNDQRLVERKDAINDLKEQKRMLLDKLSKKYGKHIVWEKGPDRKLEERGEIREKVNLIEKDLLRLKSEIKEFEIHDPDRWLINDGENSKIVELQNDLYSKREQLQQELAAMRIDFTDKHPQVVKKLAELNSLNTAFPKLAKDIIDNKVRELKRNHTNKETNLKVLLRELESVNHEIEIISNNYQKFQEFDRKIEKSAGDVARLEVYIDQLQDKITGEKRPVERTKEPFDGIMRDDTPNTIYYIMIFGVVIGLGFAYILEYLDDTIRTAHDVEKFVGLRVIGTVPLLSKGEEKLLHRIALKSPISEMMNTLSMIIQSWMLKMKGQVLLIVSSKPGEGKSTFITNLAVALCRGGEKVVLIDSDLRKPSLHRFFGVDNSVGFSNYLEDSFSTDVEDTDEAKIAKIVHHTDIEGLFIIPSGPIPSNPVGLLKGDNVERLLSHLKTYIGVILIDTPPLAMIDAGVLATKVNAVVTVMDAGKVTKKEALAGKHLIENVGGNSIGVILNKVTLEGEEYYYYFEGYSYYYGSSRHRKKKPV